MKRQRLTYREHITLGKELYKMRNCMVKRAVQISNAYGVSKKPGKLADRAYTVIDNLRCEMDDQLYRDYPGIANPYIYYPNEQNLTYKKHVALGKKMCVHRKSEKANYQKALRREVFIDD